MCRISKYELICEKVANYNVDFIDKRMGDSSEVARFIMDVLRSDTYTVEHFMVFMLDTKLKVLGFSEVSKGNLESAPVHPREVFQPVMMTAKCAAVIVAHNHPSGDPTPSFEDIRVTERLEQAGDVLGIRVIDHLIIGDGCYVSMKSEGYLQ